MSRAEFINDLAEKQRVVAVQFRSESYGLGVYILLSYGSARLWPGGKLLGPIYTTNRGHLNKALPDFKKAEIKYLANLNLPEPLKYKQALRLWELEGWVEDYYGVKRKPL